MDFDLSNGVHSMLSSITNSDFGAGATDLLKSISTYQTVAYSFANTVNHTIIAPLAATILAIMLVLELARISARVEGDQKLGAQQVAMAMIKAVMIVIAIQNVDLVLAAINQVADISIVKVSNLSSSGTLSTGGAIPTAEEIKDAGIGQQITMMMFLVIPWLATILASIIIKVIVFVRFAEIYVMTAAATIPLVFIAHPETKNITVGYLRKYAAAVLQGLVLIVVIEIFRYFNMSALKISASNMVGDAINQIGNILITPIVFILLIVSSGRLARALVGE